MLSAPKSKPLDFRFVAGYSTASSNLRRAKQLDKSDNPRDALVASELRVIESEHRKVVHLNNYPFFRLANGDPLCLLALEPLLMPGGNGKGRSSYTTTFSRRNVAAGVIAPAAHLASKADFARVFAGATDLDEQYSTYLDVVTKLNAALARITRAAFISLLPQDAQQALLVRRESRSFLTCLCCAPVV